MAAAGALAVVTVLAGALEVLLLLVELLDELPQAAMPAVSAMVRMTVSALLKLVLRMVPPPCGLP
ncbi:MAG: hypothetical protein DLM64_07105 [Solirubrobacterales bacterium]|nr:MAG: hypothetical protein DLM64_07105 [Solirubrobacterales bacterium]